MIFARLALVAAVASAVFTPAAAAACPDPEPAIRAAEVQTALNDLLRREGLAPTRVGTPAVRQIDLDGDETTAEAIVDIIAPEHCFGVTCTSLVVRRSADGTLTTAGHGTWLMPLRSRTAGWLDLGETVPVVAVRALRFQAGRYR